MKMTNRNGQGIRCIERLRQVSQAKNPVDHEAYLVLVCAAVARHRVLDLERAIFIHRYSAFGRSYQHDSFYLPQLQHTFEVCEVELTFDGERTRPVGLKQFFYFLLNSEEFSAERFLGWQPNHTGANEPMAVPVTFHDPIACGL